MYRVDADSNVKDSHVLEHWITEVAKDILQNELLGGTLVLSRFNI